jgi:cellulose synthase/poly-beta-1,6-N-acetylglucosamine synthase-like glycosyltransferase
MPRGMHSSALMIVYTLIGPGAWAVFGLSLIASYVRMSRFRRPAQPLPKPPPAVTILIPAKDEGEGVRECFERVLALDYPAFEVIAVDDRSTDQTGAIMDETSVKHGQFRALHIQPGGLPTGWLGKCNALWTATRHVTSPWLLFVDSDVKVEPDVLSAALALAVGRGYDAVSILTRLECETFWEKLILPLAAGTVGAITLMSLTNEDSKKAAFANGQFFLIRREAYEKVGGHEAVRNNITEDVALMRLLKSNGSRVRLYHGRDFASTRMHVTWQQMFNGWARIYSGVCNRQPGRILMAMAFVSVSGLSAYAALIGGLITRDSDWLALSLAHLALITIVLVEIYRLSGNPRRNALLFPISAGVLLALYANAIRACFTGRIAWRGTNYTAGSVTRA